MSSGKDEFEQKIAYAQQNWIQFEHGRFYLFFRIAPIMLRHWICVCPNLSQTNRDDIFPPNVKNALSTLNGMIKCHCDSREEKKCPKIYKMQRGSQLFLFVSVVFPLFCAFNGKSKQTIRNACNIIYVHAYLMLFLFVLCTLSSIYFKCYKNLFWSTTLNCNCCYHFLCICLVSLFSQLLSYFLFALSSCGRFSHTLQVIHKDTRLVL